MSVMMIRKTMRIIMKYITGILAIIIVLICTACIEKQNQTSVAELSAEEVLERQLKVYEDAAADPQQFKVALKESCPHFGNALLTSAETIQLGTRVFNAGGVSLTKRIYEGTIYKLLFTIKDDCMSLSDALQVGLAKAYESEDHHDQAWAMRNALDLIMGGPPSKPPGAQ